jgi:hypothetical protein
VAEEEHMTDRFALFIEGTSFSKLLRQLTRWVLSGCVKGGSIAEEERGKAVVLEDHGGEFATPCQTSVDV